MADNAQGSAGVSPMQRSEVAEFELLQPEGNEFEEKEKMKILAKRKRRVAKIQDSNLDVDQLFKRHKSYKPDDSTLDSVMSIGTGQTTLPTAPTPDLQLTLAKQSLASTSMMPKLLRQNLLSQYMEQVSEHDVANLAQNNMLKSMIKTIQVGRLTSEHTETQQDQRKSELSAVTKEE